jgi:hypothetical protein
MTRSVDSPAALNRAFDEAAYGPARTLNLRESLPTAEAARRRAEKWLRERQMTMGGEVLIITGRGNNSPGGISVVRESISGLLHSLRRQNVVESWRQHTPGSFVATLGSVTELFEAPRRRKDSAGKPRRPGRAGITGLSADTLALLRDLATRSLHALGVDDASAFVEAEMAKKFSTVVSALGKPLSETEVKKALERALSELDD